jgi:hypothetical protein
MSKEKNNGEICTSLRNLIRSYFQEKGVLLEPDIKIIVNESLIKAEFNISRDVKREIKIDVDNYTYIMYTWNSKLKVEDAYLEDNAILYLAYINSNLNSTCLVFENESGIFRYKSSQVFPRNRDFYKLFYYFCKVHDVHFPLIEDSIKNFIDCDGGFNKENAEDFLIKLRSSDSTQSFI